MKYNILLAFVVLAGLFIYPHATNASSKPDWVKQRPSLPDYYIGIGMSYKNSDDKLMKYTQDARNKALREMSSEIKVNVSSNSLLYQFEDNYSFKEKFESKVYTSVAQTLEGYEVFTWENKKEYWVMVRFNKSKYELQCRQKLDRAKMLASSYFESARKAADRGEVAQAVSGYLKAVIALQDHVGDDLTYKTVNGTINFGTDILKDLRQIYERVIFRPERTSYQMEFSHQLQEPLSLQVVMSNNEDEMLVSGLPVMFTFSRGEGVLMPQPATDNNGMVKCSVSRLISKRKQQEVTACLDLATILKNEGLDSINNPLLPYFFPRENLPCTRFEIELNKAKAYLDVDEVVFDQYQKDLPFANSIRSELNENFFAFTNNRDDADYIVRLSLRFRKGDVKQGNGYVVYLVYSDLQLSVISTQNQSEIFSDGFLEVKGMRPNSYEHALKEAREKVLVKFRNDIIPKMEEVDM